MTFPFIAKKKLTQPFLTVQEIADRETVFLQAMLQDPLFKRNFLEWFEFYDKNRENMHIYSVKRKWAEDIGQLLTGLTTELHRFVKEVLQRHSPEELFQLYPMPGVSQERFIEFAKYAKWTAEQNHRNIGSRYDFAINPSGNIFIYEINADTPSMLFESMNLQNLMSEHLGNTEAQFNENWEKWCEYVNFFEPAWAWFLSHKFLLADFCAEHGYRFEIEGIEQIVHIDSSRNPYSSMNYVSKPVVGRKSSDVSLHHADSIVPGDRRPFLTSKNTTYSHVPMVYQPLRETIKIDGASAMGCMWTYGASSACLSFREFDGLILEVDNERVIIHELVD
jgi:glutathionylspermidine synthase